MKKWEICGGCGLLKKWNFLIKPLRRLAEAIQNFNDDGDELRHHLSKLINSFGQLAKSIDCHEGLFKTGIRLIKLSLNTPDSRHYSIALSPYTAMDNHEDTRFIIQHLKNAIDYIEKYDFSGLKKKDRPIEEILYETILDSFYDFGEILHAYIEHGKKHHPRPDYFIRTTKQALEEAAAFKEPGKKRHSVRIRF